MTKIKLRMLCVTGVCLRDKTNTFCFPVSLHLNASHLGICFSCFSTIWLQEVAVTSSSRFPEQPLTFSIPFPLMNQRVQFNLNDCKVAGIRTEMNNKNTTTDCVNPTAHAEPKPTETLVASSSLARIWGECSTIYSLPTLFSFLFEVAISSHALIQPFNARISLQWLSELRWLWPNVPWQVACELVFQIGSHTIPG